MEDHGNPSRHFVHRVLHLVRHHCRFSKIGQTCRQKSVSCIDIEVQGLLKVLTTACFDGFLLVTFRESRTIQVRRRVNNGTRIDDHQQQLWDYFSQQLEESPSSALHSPDPIDSFREKRFYPMHINIGCVKGFRCCEDAKCKPFCTLCYGKQYIATNSQRRNGNFPVF